VLVLGIESTCDETGLALVRDGKEIFSNFVASQEDLHQKYGGVIPELACRRHIDVLPSLFQKTLCVPKEAIDLIAVAKGPGLIGTLLIGLNFAKGLALALNIPLVGVNHLEAHLYAVLMEQTPQFPALGVIISGGHTALVKVNGIGSYHLIGQTQDDAIGEAFDKVAKILHLPYPGGPQIEKLAQQGNPQRYRFTCGRVKGRPFDFSYSGLKTAVLYLVKGQNAAKDAPLLVKETDKADIAAGFQHAAFSCLVEKILHAAKHYQCQSILLGGGVSQNCYLRAFLEKEANVPVFWPPRGLSLDNAAMIAGLGFHTYLQKGADCIDLEPLTRIPFTHETFVSPAPFFSDDRHGCLQRP
jgi:N6-L-threonylcarbamoyladenine synthase